MHLLDDDALLARMGDYNGTPAELLANEALMQLFLPLLRDDFAMVETYACTDRTPVGCPLTALGGDADPEVSEDQLKAWAELAGGSFEYQIFAGDHFYLHAHRDEIHARLQASLQQALHQPVDALV